MARPAQLAPLHDRKKNLWYVYLSAKISPTGKPKREYFRNRKEAEARARHWRKMKEVSTGTVQKAGPKLIEKAVTYHELFRDVYGLEGGLEEACEAYLAILNAKQCSHHFGELVKFFHEAHYDGWADGTKSAWRVCKAHLKELSDTPIVSLNTQFWREWLQQKAEELHWGSSTYNSVRARIHSVYAFGIPDMVSVNPLEGVKKRKLETRAVPVYSIEQITALMNCTWEHDHEMVPFFGIAIFAGLRPGSELLKLQWEDVNFEKRWIRVAAEFDNKTQTRRFVPLEENLLAWLKPWEKAVGPVVPKVNFTKRRRWITRGKYQSAPGTSEDQWTEVAPYGDHVRDISRHTYGSYTDSIYGDRNKIKEWMGHTTFKTYDQHYRNARSPEEGQAFLEIFPPVTST
ncbi:MAG: tyrosine-type recombinase/integrase [Verrucomicrobiota bacterium]